MLNSSVMRIVLGVILTALITGITPFALTDSFNAKPCAWEIHLTTIASEALTPSDVLVKMPPEQRAKIEQSLQARSPKPMTHSSEKCATQQDLGQNPIINGQHEDSEPQCATQVISEISTKLVTERTGPAPHASTTHMTAEAKMSERIVGSIDMT